MFSFNSWKSIFGELSYPLCDSEERSDFSEIIDIIATDD